MRPVLTLILVAALAPLACGERPADDQPEHGAAAGASKDLAAAGVPDDDLHRGLATIADDETHGAVQLGETDPDMGINRELNLPGDIRAAWSGIRVLLVEGIPAE